MATDYLAYIGEFVHNNFLALLIALIGAFVGAAKFTFNGFKRLNTIYVVHGKKSSSVKQEHLLGLRPVPAYYKLDEFQALKEALKRGGHVLVVGAPLSGKTRAIYEALKTMNPAANIIIPKLLDVDLEKFEVPLNIAFWRKTILVLDDIDKFIEKQNFRYLVDEFLKNKAVIIASCRSGIEFEKLQKVEWLNYLFKKENIRFPEKIPDEKGKEIAAKIGVEWKPLEFDGKIGSLVMPLEIMSRRFTESRPEEKAVLKSIRLLYNAGIYQEKEKFSIKRILHLGKVLFGINLEKYQTDVLFSNIEKKNFIRIINDDIILAEEAYLGSVIEPDGIEADRISFFTKIAGFFSGDAEALFSLGNRAFGIGTVDINKKDYMQVSIAAYEEALKVYTLDRFPMQYASIQNNLGITYGTLAEVENQAENCKKSIAAFEEALKVYTPDRFPMQYAMTQNNLGAAYRTLAEVENKAENCKKSIVTFEDALKIRTFDRFPMQYASIQNNLGNAFQTLAEVENKAENCKKSITAFEEALKVYTFKDYPMDFVMTQNNLGNAYRIFAEVENKAENCKKSIAACEEALEVYTLDRFPMQYAMTQNNLGNAYQLLAEVENKAENCKKSIAAYEEALKVTTLDRSPMGYAMTQNNLGNAYRTLAEVENKAENCRKSITACQEALKVYNLDRFPMQYASIQNNLGNAYRILAEVENMAENCKKAIAAYEEALKDYTLDRFPMQYSMTQYNLGNAYRILAEAENMVENCKKAIAAFEEALKVYTPDRFPMQYAMTQNNLGATYQTLAEVENKTENCKKSIVAYEEALEIYTKDEFPELYKVISRNLERTKIFCSQNI